MTSEKINELETYFSTINLPDGRFKLNEYTTIIDCKGFVKAHLNTLKANVGNQRFTPFFDRLNEFKKALENA